MAKHSKSKTKLHSQHAVLCLLGHLASTQGWFEPVRTLVKIKQKTVLHSPADKLLDCLLGMLCGIEAVCQINTELAVDPAVSAAFGRPSCADQSTIQETLSAATFENVAQMRAANAQIFEKLSLSCRHDYTQQCLILDLDMTGLPCSARYEGAAAGYFAGCKKGTHGRQLCRISASQYNEIVYEQIFPGNTGSVNFAVFKQIVEGALQVLGAEKIDKGRLLLRLDGGDGTAEIINYLLAEGYQFIVKLHSGLRAKKLVKELAEEQWQTEASSQRSWALLAEAENEFYEQASSRGLRQIAVRCPHQPGAKTKAAPPTSREVDQTEVNVGESNPKNEESSYAYSVLVVCRQDLKASSPSEALLAAQLAFYDDRACIESASFRGDKQGLGLARRRKKSLAGQEMLILLAQLAHNFLIWVKAKLVEEEARLEEYGTQRWIRDLLSVPGRVIFKAGQIVKVRLSGRHSLMRRFFEAFARFFGRSGIRLILAET